MQIERIGNVIKVNFPAHGPRLAQLNESEAKPVVQASDKIDIKYKVRCQRGQVYGGDSSGMFAQLGKNEEGLTTLHLTGRYGNVDVDRVFTEGQVVREDSYNFDFLGVIEKITEKSVTIAVEHRSSSKRHDLATFAIRNYNFDLEKSNKQRAEWYD